MQRKTVLISLAAVTILVLASLSVAIIAVNVNNNNGEKEVVNSAMRVKGIEKDGVDLYRNIPYAEAPVGELRFAAPVFKEANWTEIKDCTKWGNIPIQSHIYTSEDSRSTYHGEKENEDCLNLNIWVPAGAKAGDKLPVYVWIYGGAYMSGDAQNSMYDGTRFAQEGVIVVTFNYRVGALGFLCLDNLKTADGSSGNWGTLDQICALKWVNTYIEKFGGDKNNVTIGGESAGSFSVFNMVMSPLTKDKGYFQKAIMESGIDSATSKSMRSYSEAHAVSTAIAKKVGADDSVEGVKKLREMDPYLLSNETDINEFLSEYCDCVWPVKDGVVLPEDFWEAIDNGKFNNVKMIIGYNSFEGLLFTDPNVTEVGLNKVINDNFKGDDIKTVQDYYADKRQNLGWSMYDCVAELTAMAMFKLGADKAQKMLSAKGVEVYGYQFCHRTSLDDIVPYHSVEIEFAFGHDTVSGMELTAEDKVIREQMHGHWLNFIKTGNPNGHGLDKWEKYNTAEDHVMSYLKYQTFMMPKLETKTFDFLNPLYFKTA